MAEKLTAACECFRKALVGSKPLPRASRSVNLIEDKLDTLNPTLGEKHG